MNCVEPHQYMQGIDDEELEQMMRTVLIEERENLALSVVYIYARNSD
jgi:hypothetical protein